MAAETSPSMEEFIKNTNSFGKHRLSGKLYLWVGKSGKKTFKLRSNIDGKDKFIPIGQYPVMNPDQAWEKAKEWQAKIDNARRINEEAEWNDRVNQSIAQRGLYPINEKCRSFAGEEEAGQFIRKLFKVETPPPPAKVGAVTQPGAAAEAVKHLRQNESTDEEQNHILTTAASTDETKSDSGLKTEIRLAIWLQMLLIPSRPSELLLAKRKDFDLDSRLWTTIKEGKTKVTNIPYVKNRVTILSHSAMTAIRELDSLPAPVESNGLPVERYLFPHLAKMKKYLRDETISKEMQRIWPSFIIEIDGFRAFFKSITSNNGYYRQKFANEMLKRIDGNGDLFKDSEYIHHRKLLADWWGEGLAWLRNPASAQQPTGLSSSDLKRLRMTKPKLPGLFLKEEPERTLPRIPTKERWVAK